MGAGWRGACGPGSAGGGEGAVQAGALPWPMTRRQRAKAGCASFRRGATVVSSTQLLQADEMLRRRRRRRPSLPPIVSDPRRAPICPPRPPSHLRPQRVRACGRRGLAGLGRGLAGLGWRLGASARMREARAQQRAALVIWPARSLGPAPKAPKRRVRATSADIHWSRQKGRFSYPSTWKVRRASRKMPAAARQCGVEHSEPRRPPLSFRGSPRRSPRKRLSAFRTARGPQQCANKITSVPLGSAEGVAVVPWWR